MDHLTLHIGLMKTGTTYLQAVLKQNRQAIADRGVLYPGPTWARQARAVSDLIGRWHAPKGAWESLRPELAAHPGPALISFEGLAAVSPVSEVERIVASLPTDDVRAVATVRDLGRTIPSAWQETMKNGWTWTFEEFLTSLRDGGQAGERFWSQQSAAGVVERWAAAVGPERMTVVTVPPPGADRDLLWRRFCEAAGLGDGPWEPAPRANESLGLASTLVLRRLNGALQDLHRDDYLSTVKALARDHLSARKATEPALGFAVPDWVRERAAQERAAVAAAGVRVVGDLAELEPVDVPGDDPAQVPAAAQLDATIAAMADVVLHPRPKVSRQVRKGEVREADHDPSLAGRLRG